MSEPLPPSHMHSMQCAGCCTRISCNTSMEIDGWITYIQSVPKRFKIIFLRFGYSGRFLAKVAKSAQSAQKCQNVSRASKSAQSCQTSKKVFGTPVVA